MTRSPSQMSYAARHGSTWRGAAALTLVLACLGLLAGGEARQTPEAEPANASVNVSKNASASKLADATAASSDPAVKRPYTTETLRGKVVWLSDALERLYGVATEPAAAESSVVLETSEGHLLPIIPDTRGQSFVVDGRLRGIDLELPVRRYQGVSLVQVIRVLTRRADGLYEIDYWCDVCAIPMYILKDCECCQGPTRLREQLVEKEADKVEKSADKNSQR
jgi:hypothetical protein